MNTIILKHNEKMLTKEEYRKLEKGDLIWGDAETPEEVKRWTFDESNANEVKEKAKEELKKYRCRYEKNDQLMNVEEYALEYCETDQAGEFVEGSDYDLAPGTTEKKE